MQLNLELPDDVAGPLTRASGNANLTLEAFATEVLRQAALTEQAGAASTLDAQPDWQAAIERSRADLAAGRVHTHDEVRAWHQARRD
jgi:predicted transcriptional regulator